MSTESDQAKKASLKELYFSFLRIGAMMFGGGYAMLPLLTKEIIDRHRWASEEEILDYFSLSQCTPGTIAVNTATFIGKKLRGLSGAAAATAGVVTVPFFLILLIAAVLHTIWAAPAVTHAFRGIRAAICALILSAVVRLVRKGVRTPFAVILFLTGFCLVILLDISPVIAVLVGAAAGILAGRFRKS